LCTGSGKKVASWVAVDADLHEADILVDARGKDMRLDRHSAMLHSDPWMDVADTFPKVVAVAEENFVDILEALVVGQKRTMKERHHLG
jgi:hypothetical protein